MGDAGVAADDEPSRRHDREQLRGRCGPATDVIRPAHRLGPRVAGRQRRRLLRARPSGRRGSGAAEVTDDDGEPLDRPAASHRGCPHVDDGRAGAGPGLRRTGQPQVGPIGEATQTGLDESAPPVHLMLVVTPPRSVRVLGSRVG